MPTGSHSEVIGKDMSSGILNAKYGSGQLLRDESPQAVSEDLGLLYFQKRLPEYPATPELPLSVLVAVSVCAFVGTAVFVATVVVVIGRFHERRLHRRNCVDQRTGSAAGTQVGQDIENQAPVEKLAAPVGDAKETNQSLSCQPTPSPIFEFSPPSPNWRPQLPSQLTPLTVPAKVFEKQDEKGPRQQASRNQADGVYTFGLEFPLPPSENTEHAARRNTYIAQTKSAQANSVDITKPERPTSSPPIMSTDVSCNTIASLSVSEESYAGPPSSNRRRRKMQPSSTTGDQARLDPEQNLDSKKHENEIQSSTSEPASAVATLDSDVSLLASSSRVFIAPLAPFAPILATNLPVTPRKTRSIRKIRSQRSLTSREQYNLTFTNIYVINL